MKRLFLTSAIAMLSMTMTFAENENASKTDAFIMNTNIKSITRYLELTKQQETDVQDIYTSFCNDLKEVASADEKKKSSLLKLALKRNCMYMDIALDKKQYKKYLVVLNATMHNRGLRK